MTQAVSVLKDQDLDEELVHWTSCFSDDVAVCGWDITNTPWENDDVSVNCYECILRVDQHLPCNDERCNEW